MADQLLQEGILAKFLRYVQIDTASDETGAGTPSTAGQWQLAHLLAEELVRMGLTDVQVDAHAIVTASLAGQAGAPVVGLLAHMDTSPSVSGKNVRPLVHSTFTGCLQLPGGSLLDATLNPALSRVVGHTLVTSDGTTLLGADDKAGIAIIMEAICTLLRRPDLPHSPIRIAFTPDEEIGRGIKEFPVAQFGAAVAYTLDGGELGEMHDENFNARNIRIVFQGRSAHTGSARGRMINALGLAAAFITAIPATMRPETTSGREGFIHVDALSGTVEEAELVVLMRSFTSEGLADQQNWVQSTCRCLELGNPGSAVTVEEMRGYANMKTAVEQDPRIVAYLRQAMLDAGVQPLPRAIRGGTDGAELSARGLPTPNIFVGGGDFHSRGEWVSVQWMEKAVEVVVRLVGLWAANAEAQAPTG